MNLEQIIQTLDLKILTEPKDLASIQPTTGYTSDLLSCVMSGAPKHSLWITIQAHTNIVAVAALLDLSAVIISEGGSPDQPTIDKANEEGITLLSSKKSNFYLAGRLWEMGIRDE